MSAPNNKLVARLVRAVMLLALTLGATTTALPSTLEDYKTRVDSARTLAIEIEQSLRDSPAASVQTRELAEQIRKDFPASERIEWEGGYVETGNQWLLDKAAALELFERD